MVSFKEMASDEELNYQLYWHNVSVISRKCLTFRPELVIRILKNSPENADVLSFDLGFLEISVGFFDDEATILTYAKSLTDID